MQPQTHNAYLNATGNIAHNMTNDYMFRYILQKNEKVLRGLTASLLHLNPTTIKRLTIRNPINLAEDISGKDFILDIEVMMNDDQLINLEMQITNKHNWAEWSLSYLVVHSINCMKVRITVKHFLSIISVFLTLHYFLNILNSSPPIKCSISKIITCTVVNFPFP